MEIDDKRQTTITGEGYADLVLIPRKNVSSPALVIELKYDKDTQAAISQIKKRNYPQQVAEYTGDIRKQSIFAVLRMTVSSQFLPYCA